MDVQRYATEKLKGGRCDGKDGGMSRVSVRKHLNVLKQAFSDAVLYDIIPQSPALHVKLPRVATISKDVQFLSIAQSQTLLAAFEGTFQTMVLVALYYGLRRSEVLGLRWSAIDFTEDTLTISHTVVKNFTIECKDRTKTASSRRCFMLFPDVRQALLELRERQQAERAARIAEGKSYTENDYLFRYEDGRLFRPDYVTRAFERTARKCTLPGIRFHDLRHSTASILFERGWNVKDVQVWLGHADIQTTLDIYVHYTRTRKILKGQDFAGTLTACATPKVVEA